jgi:hypothetical protein
VLPKSHSDAQFTIVGLFEYGSSIESVTYFGSIKLAFWSHCNVLHKSRLYVQINIGGLGESLRSTIKYDLLHKY